MRLKQREYCHNCDKYVIFEFDDINERQVIICPSCGHEHYRELDDTTILNIHTHNSQGELLIHHMPEISVCEAGDVPEFIEVTTEVREIVGTTEDGRPMVKPKEGEETQKAVSNRRWGRDPRQ